MGQASSQHVSSCHSPHPAPTCRPPPKQDPWEDPAPEHRVLGAGHGCCHCHWPPSV